MAPPTNSTCQQECTETTFSYQVIEKLNTDKLTINNDDCVKLANRYQAYNKVRDWKILGDLSSEQK